jgi:inner membrane protein
MNGITHKIAGACTGAVIASKIPHAAQYEYALIITGSVIGSLYPDIDEPHSIFGSKVKPFSWLAKIFLGHRGIIHTPLNCIVITGLLYLLHLKVAPTLFSDINYANLPWMYYLTLGFFAGYASHLLLDFLTPQGIMLLYPFSTYRFHILGLRGFVRDMLFTGLIVVFTVLYFLQHLGIVKLLIVL